MEKVGDGVKFCSEVQEDQMEPRSPSKHALAVCLWSGIAQGTPCWTPSAEACRRWEMGWDAEKKQTQRALGKLGTSG